MKKQMNKNYNKALRYYENGYIDKALEYLELSISENLKNKGALNLKGLLLYLRGDLDKAIATWKINYEFNDDSIAKGYINDSKRDRERLGYYNKADNLLKQLKVDEAIEYLDKCRESDFNAIKVNIALGICYFKKGRYEESSVYISKALNIEKNNSLCIKIAKELKEYTDINIMETNKNYKKILISTCLVIFIICGSIGVYRIFTKEDGIDNKNDINNVQVNTNEIEEVSDDSNEIVEDVDFSIFEKALEGKDYDLLYSFVENLKGKVLQGKEKALYVNGLELLKSEGVKFFYEDGMKYYDNKDFVNAKIKLNRAYEFGETSYLYPHILFFNGTVSEKVGDKNSKKYYEEYVEKINSEDTAYTEESLYRLSILYKEENLEKSIYYANIITEKYPKSIYNNDVIKGILKLNN